MNRKFKLKQRIAALCMVAMMCCSLFPAGAFAEAPRADADGTPIVVQDNENVTPDAPQTEESDPDPGENTPEDSETSIVTQSADEDAPVETSTDYTFDGAVLYTDLPDAPTGSYMGSQGLPVATGETKIGISAWPNDQLEESTDSYLSADTLNSDDLTMIAPLLEGTDYAVAPILAQVEYPADGSSLDVVLPNEVTVLDFYGVPADEAARSSLVHSEYAETSAAVMGLYVQADADFSAQLVYTAPDGSTLTKVLHVVIDRSRTMAAPFAEVTDVAAYAERPTPAVTSGKITKVEKVNGTWLIWFNGEEAYCCTHGANGQPKGCPPYTYTNTSLVSADQCIPGDHYGNQYRIWGGLDQLSMEFLPDTPVAFSAEDTEEISLLDFCRTIYDDTQMWLIENYPASTAAKIYLESAQALLDGAVAYAKPRGYYTYIYTPARSGWQTVALIGPEISEEETEEPKPVVQEYYASWEAPAQSASGTVDLTYGITTDKIQLKTLEKVDGATIEIEPITKSGTIDGGSWSISPAGVQTITTGGHTNDDNYQNSGGTASASWSVHYTVSKTVDGRSGSVGPYTTKEAADAAANSERDSAVAAIQAEAQSAVNNAIASAQAQLASLQFRYDEVTIPFGFESYWGSNGSHQTITVSANSNNAYKMRNTEWSLQINIKKTDSETGNQIAGDVQYEIYQWDVVTGKYQPTGGYNTYSVQRQGDGTYAVINSAAYATNDTMRHRDRYQFGDKIGKTMYLRGIAPEMKNGLFSMLSELPFDHVITMHVDAMDQAEAVQEIEKKLAYMHKEEYDAIAKARERNMPASIAVSYDLKSKMHHTEQMMDDITTKNQKIFKVCILIHTYGDSNAQLDERVRRICSTVQQQTCRFDSILYEQRNAMNSMLPLGKKWLGLERTLETVSTAIYVPFTTQELFQPGGLYEGINARSKNLILCNRKLLPAPAGMVLGMTGYGKSFSVMQMVTNIMLRWPDDDIVLIDPEQEYTHLVTAMGGVVIDISASSPSHINPMDITEDYGDDEDPIRLKSQFLQNFCQLILHSSELSPQERTFIDVAASLTYQRYMANPKREEMPTLHDFYRNLALQGEEVKPLLTALKLYVSGSMDLFAHQTNVNVQNHCICFNTVKLGKSMQSIGMLTVLDQVWNRITRNRVLGRRTWVFTDEFQQLLGNKDCTDFYFQLSSRARKWGAILTSITQHVRSVLDNEDARRMLSDCGYIKLLKQSPDDANDLARLLHISNEEKRYIENAEVGSGLLIVSKTVVPFNNDFPKDTELFRLMDTSPNRKPSEKG